MADGTRSVRIQSYTTYSAREKLDQEFHWRDIDGITSEDTLAKAKDELLGEGAFLAYFDEQTGEQFKVTGFGQGSYENARDYLKGK